MGLTLLKDVERGECVTNGQPSYSHGSVFYLKLQIYFEIKGLLFHNLHDIIGNKATMGVLGSH